MMKRVNQFNYWLMSGLANANATAWTVYLLVFSIVKVWTISPPHTLGEWLTAIVNTLYQGAALPLISFVAKVEGQKSREESQKNNVLIQETHDTVMVELAKIQNHQQVCECCQRDDLK